MTHHPTPGRATHAPSPKERVAHARRATPALAWGAMAAMLFVSQLGGCSCDDGTGGGPDGPAGGLDAKFSVMPPPELVNDPMLQVSGTGAADTFVQRVLNDSAPELHATVSFVESWSGTLTLQEGENTMSFFPVDASGAMGTPSEEFVVVLDTTPPGAPTLDDPEACIGTPTYTVTGSTEAGATVQVDGTLIDTADDGTFSYEVTLDGETTAEFTAVDEAGNTSEAASVTLTPGVQTPTLDAPSSPTGETTQTLTGAKAAGTGIWLTFDGADAMNIVPVDDEETWSAEVEFALGDNTFSIEARDGDGNVSCETVGPQEVLVSDVCPVEVDDSGFTSPTNDPTLTVPGTKCADTGVFLYYEGEDFSDATEQVAVDGSDAFSFDLTLMEGDNTFYVLLQDDNGLWGPSDGPFTVILDTVPPEAPTFDEDTEEQTLEFEATLSGAKESGASVCVRVDQEVECTEEVAVNNSEDWEFDLDLQAGMNFVCISSFDAAGNQSEETCITIEQGAGDGLTIVDPANGSVIGNEPTSVAALVNSEECDDISRVEMCLDGECLDAAQVGQTNRYTVALPAGGDFENGSIHTISATGHCADDSIFGVDQITVLYVISGILVSDTVPTETSARARIAIDGEGAVHVVWRDDCVGDADCESSQEGNLPADIFHRSFADGVWTDIALVSNADGDADSRNPAIATDADGNIHVVWEDDGDIDGSGGDFDIIHRMYDVDADAWGEVSVVTAYETEEDARPDGNADIAAGTDGSVHIVWSFIAGGEDRDILYSTFDGADFSDPLLLSDQDGNLASVNPTIDVDDNDNAIVVWQEDGDVLGGGDDADIILRSVTAGVAGESFLVTDNSLDGDSRFPDVAVDSSGVAHIVWNDTASVQSSGDDRDIFHRTFDIDADEPFSFAYSLVSGGANDGNSENAAVVADPSSNRIFVTWTDTGGGNPDIYYNVGVDGAFNAPVGISAGFDDFSFRPAAAYDADSDTLHIVWEDDTTVGDDGDDTDVFYLGVSP